MHTRSRSLLLRPQWCVRREKWEFSAQEITLYLLQFVATHKSEDKIGARPPARLLPDPLRTSATMCVRARVAAAVYQADKGVSMLVDTFSLTCLSACP